MLKEFLHFIRDCMRELAQTDLFMCIIKEDTSRVRDEILNWRRSSHKRKKPNCGGCNSLGNALNRSVVVVYTDLGGEDATSTSSERL